MFLYLNVRGGKASLSKAALDLKIPEARIDRAFNVLVMFGVAAPDGAAPVKAPLPPDPRELLALKEGDESFKGVCNYYETAVGRIMTKQELEALSFLHFELSLPADLLCLIINYVREEKHLTMRNLERVCYEWHDDGAVTYEEGVARLGSLREKKSRYYTVLRLFGIRDRAPSDTERKFIDSWADMGFSDDMIKLAYEKTVMRTGKVSFAYINGILERWRQSGVSDPASAGLRDAPPAEKKTPEERVAAAFEKKRRDRELTARKRLAELAASSPEFAENEKNIKLLASKAARAAGTARKELLTERDRLIGERAAILRSLSLPADWLEPRPECPVCSDTGYVGANMCECLKKALTAAGVKLKES
ncbi:MAG: DnaD domain protein [Clostridia bacterium]|nr:DnaD domain protein [Clostridia bacterium]